MPGTRLIVLAVAAALVASAQQKETLSYSINWPSGLSLGEGSITAVESGHYWDLALKLEATIPGFPIRDEFRSRVADGLCSVTFEKESTHGSRVAAEKSTFDATSKMMRRETSKGGKSELTPRAITRRGWTCPPERRRPAPHFFSKIGRRKFASSVKSDGEFCAIHSVSFTPCFTLS